MEWRKLLDLIRLDPTRKIILEKRFVKLNKILLNLKLKRLELRLQDWFLVISRLYYNNSLYSYSKPNPSQKFSWILFGIVSNQNSNLPLKWKHFLFIREAKSEPTYILDPWECIRVLEIRYASWKSQNCNSFLGLDCGTDLTL